MTGKSAASALGVAILSALAGCGGGASTPTSPPESPGVLALSEVQVLVDGQVVNGLVVHHGDDHVGGVTRYEATLTMDGLEVTGHPVFLDITTPDGMGGHHGGGPHGGLVELWDDGSHGDHAPGDGHYAFEADGGRMGLHHTGAPHGEYSCDFWAEQDGQETPHVVIGVRVED